MTQGTALPENSRLTVEKELTDAAIAFVSERCMKVDASHDWTYVSAVKMKGYLRLPAATRIPIAGIYNEYER
jgi:hypothetical protein